mgnify:CR=1 FL=1
MPPMTRAATLGAPSVVVPALTTVPLGQSATVVQLAHISGVSSTPQSSLTIPYLPGSAVGAH